MDQKLLYRLKAWRAKQSQKEGVELFRVLPNATLEEIAKTIPMTPGDFLKVKGIKEGKWSKYGPMLLAMTRDVGVLPDVAEEEISVEKIVKAEAVSSDVRSIFDDQKIVNEILEVSEDDDFSHIPGGRTLYTVSSFLDALNTLFGEMVVRVKGEISSVDIRDRAIYFSLKDSQDGSVLSALIFRYQYDVSGVKLEIGQEVIIEGSPQIWKPTGRLSLKAQSIEVSGEGALQKAYNELKKKLEDEGLFDVSRKRALKEFPERIALITSNQGAAIGDFMMNLGKYGFKISLFNASVEGKRAVFDLIEAVKYFNQHPERYDVLVIIRGGGSLESLQAFNNESLVREVAQSKIPTLCGIGHEKDVSLVAMVGDVMVSTPTATARALRESFEKADALLIRYEQRLINTFEESLQSVRTQCEDAASFFLQQLQDVQEKFVRIHYAFSRSLEKLHFTMQNKWEVILQIQKAMVKQYAFCLDSAKNVIQQRESQLAMHNPERLLRLGYSLVMKEGKLVRSAKDMRVNDVLTTKFSDGSITSVVRNIEQ